MAEIIHQTMNQILSKSKLSLNLSIGRGRGLFLSQSIPKSTRITSLTPLVTWIDSKQKIRLDRHCNHCFQSNKLNLCSSCLELPELYQELKDDHKDILNLREHYGEDYTGAEAILHKLVLRICHERRSGYENTLFFIESFLVPEIPSDASLSLQGDYELFLSYLNHIGFTKEEYESFLTLDWYVKTLGIIYVNCITTHQGTAIYDVLSFVNHSCQPNIGLELKGFNASLYALNDLQIGDEIFLDYSTLREEYKTFAGKTEKEKKFHFLKDLYGFDCQSTCSCSNN